MLKIRLQRVGRKHEPSFRLVLTDSKNSTKSGRFKEILGSYDPRKTNEAIKTDRVKHWLTMGAGLTDSVHNLLINKGIIEGKKKNVLPKKNPPVKEEVASESSITEAAPAQAVETPAATPETSEESPSEVAELAPEPAQEVSEEAVSPEETPKEEEQTQ